MKSIWFWLALSLLLLSQVAYAAGKLPPDDFEPLQCNVKGQNYTEITFFTVGLAPDDDLFKSNVVYITNRAGKQRQETLWYTGDYNADEDYIFNESNLKVGETYQIMLVNEGKDGGTRYYRRGANIDDQTVDDYWQFIGASEKSMKSGSLMVNTDGYIHYLKCSEDKTEIEIEYEQCAYFPDSFQSNTFSSGKLLVACHLVVTERRSLYRQNASCRFLKSPVQAAKQGVNTQVVTLKVVCTTLA